MVILCLGDPFKQMVNDPEEFILVRLFQPTPEGAHLVGHHVEHGRKVAHSQALQDIFDKLDEDGLLHELVGRQTQTQHFQEVFEVIQSLGGQLIIFFVTLVAGIEGEIAKVLI